MTASTALAARIAVKALLAAQLSTTTRVTWGGPSETEDLAQEMVYLGPVQRRVEIHAMGQPATQRGSFYEEYNFPVIAIGKLEGDDEQAAETRAWALVDVIEQAIRADLSLGNLLNNGAEFGNQEVSTEPLPDGWLYRASVELVCTGTV